MSRTKLTTAPASLLPVLYSLGALEPGERAEMERRRRGDAALDRAITEWETRFAPLALAAPEVAPPASLWDRIEAALDAAESAADLRVIRYGRIDWEAWAPGLEVKILTRGPAGEPETFLMRMQPGAVVPQHLHDRAEECLVIEGDLEHEGETLGPGDFTIARPGGVHAEMVSRGGGLLYVRYLPA